MTFAPATLPWLLAFELRISWRYILRGFGNKKRGVIITFGILALAGLAFGAPMGLATRRLVEIPDLGLLMLNAGLAAMAVMLIAGGISNATLAFFDRGDLDLLLSSPLSPRKVLAARMVMLTFNSAATILMLVTPFLLTAAVLGGHWPWLAGYLIIISLALLGTTLGVSLAMMLFRLVGPRRTRTLGQVFATMIGASIFLFSQLPAIMGKGKSRNLFQWLREWTQNHEVPAWALWPAKAALGAPLPLIGIVGLSLGVFALTVWMLGARFADDAALASGAATRTRKGLRARRMVFKAGLMHNMIGKELKLLLRDPALISQALLQIVFLAPVLLGVTRAAMGENKDIARIVTLSVGAGTTVMLAGMLAGGLGWLTISAEDAPELLLSAPVERKQVGYAKVAATVIPVVVLLAIPVGVLIWFAPWVGVCAGLGAVLCATAIGFLELWMQRPGKRSEFRMRRKGSGGVLITLFEVSVSMLAGTAVGLLAAGPSWSIFGRVPGSALALIPAALAVAMLAAVKKDKWLNG